MPRLISPGVRLMNRLAYPRKFVLISLLFAIPLALVLTLWLREIGARIAFAERERAGLAYVVALRQLLDPLERMQGLAHLESAPGGAGTSELAAQRVRAAEAADRVDRVNRQWGAQFETGAEWQTLRRWQAIPSVPPEALVGQTLRLLAKVGDASKLVLDPGLDSYYLINAVVVWLPGLVQHLGEIGAGLVERRAAGALDPAREARLLAALELARAQLDALNRGHAVALGANPALRTALDPALTATRAALDEITVMLGDAGIGAVLPVGPPLEPRATFDLYTSALAAVFAHYDTAAAALDGVLAARIRTLGMRRTLLLLLVAAAMALVAYLWVAFYVAVKRAVDALDHVSTRMLTGDFGDPVELDARDELRKVVESFNSVAARLRTEWARAQDESARARAAEASLTVARDAAEAATRAKSEFLAVMSHEIRTPMNGILGMTHLLLGTSLDPEQRRFAEAVRDSGEALLTILNDILDFSKMEAGKLDLAAVDFEVAGVVSSVTTLMAPRAREKDVALEATVAPGVPPTLHGDAGRLRQILLNLVGNAIKFTEAGAVRVTVEGVGARGALPTIRVAVSDTGIGVPDEAQRQLFQEFSQVSQPDGRRFGGTGLGLAISKRIVTAMGGEIGVQSAPGRGSTFWFTVTLPRGAEMAPAAPARLEAPQAPLRILVAEDNPMNQQVALGLLRRQGHTVDVVADGRAAVEAVSASRYDVVLMDVHMPGVDGLEATRRIRRLPDDRSRIAVIALTASVMRGETEQCLAAGMNAQLPKPIDPIALAAILSQHAPSTAGAAAPSSGAGRSEPPPVAAAEADLALAGPRSGPGAPPSPARASPLPAGESIIDETYVGLLVEALGAAKVRELITGLPDDARGYRDRLAEARGRGDLSGARLAAHGLRGIAANLGLTSLADLTGAIEGACAVGASERVAQLCDGLDARLDESLARVRAMVL